MVQALRTYSALSIAVAMVSMAAAQVPTTYNANTTRTAIAKPALPSPGPAGSRFIDPAFGSRLLRVTDPGTHPNLQDTSWVTASAAHQLAWNADSTRFWVRSISGAYIAYDFDGAAMTASRIATTTSGGDGLIFSQLEPQFSFLAPNVLYGTRQASIPIRPVVRRYDFNTHSYTDILDLGAITTLITPSYARALAGSATVPEKLSVLFGGAQQDQDFKVAAFEAGSPLSTAAVLDSLASTITRGGVTQPTSIPLGFLLHHQWMDLSGRYILLFPVSGSFASPLPYFVWDLQGDTVTRVNRFPGGHEAAGHGWHVNQDCCTSTGYDGAQWQLRPLSNPAATMDLINPVQTPAAPFLADHTSWNNAQPAARVPILSSLYRYGTIDPPWRAWDDEIVAIQTDAAPAGATVWRFAHHRSAIRYDGGGSSSIYFWYLPRAMISPNGRFAMFTSNWEKTLGASITGEDGGDYRTDVFIVSLVRPDVFTDDPLIAGVTVVKAVHVTELRERIDALRVRFGVGVYSWTDAGLAGSPIKALHVQELRTALLEAYAAAKVPAPTFTDSTLTVIRALHVQELRTALAHLEAQ